MDVILDYLINAIPFVIYTVLLVRLERSWAYLKHCEASEKVRRLMAIIAILAICTVLFMAANAYALFALGKTLLSMRVFQMFVLGNCVAYWMVLDLVTWEVKQDLGE